jgi:hypothetical protein
LCALEFAQSKKIYSAGGVLASHLLELKALSPMYVTDDSSMLIFWMDDRQPKKANDPMD